MPNRFLKLQNLLKSNQRLFWFLHAAGWLAYALANILGALELERTVSYNMVILTSTVSGFALSLLLRYWNRFLWAKPPLWQVVGATGMSFLLALPWTWLRNEFLWHTYKIWYEPQSLGDYVSGVTGSSYVLLCWSGLYFGIKYYQILQLQIRRSLESAAAAHEAQLKMLRYQLNPHFLFNTLNSISTLILEKQIEAANRSVTRLSEFLRYTLDNDPMKKVTLAQEIHALDLYLSIEKVRFDERLRLNYEIAKETENALVPSMILQPLIENALKYAIAPRVDGGSIGVITRLEGQTVVIIVEDDGPGIDMDKIKADGERDGVGLANTRQRLSQIYGTDHYFECRNRESGGLEITISIPLETDLAAG